MHEQRADALQLAVGKPAALVTNGASRAITRDPLSDGQIVGLVKEIAGARRRRAGRGRDAGERSATTRRAGRSRWSSRPARTGPRATVRAGRAGDGAPRRRRRARPRRRRAGRSKRCSGSWSRRSASDLHLRSGEPPLLRRHGELVREHARAGPRRAAGDHAARASCRRKRDRRVPRDARHRLGLRDRGARALPLQRGPRPPRPDRACSASFPRPSSPPTRWD